MSSMNALFVEMNRIVMTLPPTVPSGSTPTRVDIHGFERVVAMISVANATGVTGSAITLLQSQDTTGTAEKALAFSTVYAVTDTSITDVPTVVAVTNNTFTTATTSSKNLLYVIEIDPSTLDVNNSFDCMRVGTGNATAATVTVHMILRDAKYGKQFPASALT